MRFELVFDAAAWQKRRLWRQISLSNLLKSYMHRPWWELPIWIRGQRSQTGGY